MDDSKILITGAHGQLGTALRQKYPKAKATDHSELDISDPQAVGRFEWEGIEVIINAAAYTDVDGAETAEGRITAWKVNALGVANLAKIARQKDILLIHISSDYVFDGAQNPHLESEALSPLSSYGASKAAGDIIAGNLPKHYLLRSSWIIGEGKNFVRTMLGLAQKGVAPTVVADQVGRPTFTGQLVDAISHLLTSGCPYGIYNVTNDGDPVSWAGLAREIFKLAGYDLAVTDTTTAEYFAGRPGAAPRPLNSAFELSKIKATGLELTDWRQALADYVKKEVRA